MITIGENCHIRSGFLSNLVGLSQRSIVCARGTGKITIGNNVFIGCNSLILKGSIIGDNSVIGAGSVVCGAIPPNCVAAGNPARVVKKLEEEKYAPINDSNSDIQ